MSEPSELRSPCPGCGKSLRFPPGTQPGKHFKCPRCATRVAVPGPAAKREAPAFLETCPACAKGRVIAEKGGEEGTFACTHCESRISETMLGFLYIKIDPAFVPDAEAVKSRLFTRPQLKNLSEAAARTGKTSLAAEGAPARPAPKPKPAPPAPAEPEAAPAEPPLTPAQPKQQGGLAAEPAPPSEAPAAPTAEGEPAPEEGLSAEDLMGELEAAGPGDGLEDAEEDLWWEVDEEALAARGDAPAPPADSPKSGDGEGEGFNVDDLLDDLR